MRWLDTITDSVNMNLSKPWDIVEDKRNLACCSPWGFRVGHDLVTKHHHQDKIDKFPILMVKDCSNTPFH